MPIIKTICFGEIGKNRKNVYDFFFSDQKISSQLVLDNRTEDEFISCFIDDIKNAKPDELELLKSSYDFVLQIAKDVREKVVVVDLGWGGTVQTLFQEFCRYAGIKKQVSGLYLGCHPSDRFGVSSKMCGYLLQNVRDDKNDRKLWHPVIWEYAFTNKIQFESDMIYLPLVREGFEAGAKFFRKITLDPKSYFDLVTRPQILRLCSHPRKDEVANLARIEFDSGFTNDEASIFHIVDTSYSLLGFWNRLLTKPRSTIKNIIYQQNCWPNGYAKYYHLFWFKPARWVYQKIKRFARK